jgi:hypothetical protein
MDPAVQFFGAVRTLAYHGGGLQERLADAYADNLLVLTSQDLPPELQTSFRELESRLNTADPQDDDPFQAAASQLSDDEARTLIDCIIVLYAKLAGTADSGGT